MHTENQCYCNSKQLYRHDYTQQTFKLPNSNVQIDLKPRYDCHILKNTQSQSKQSLTSSSLYQSLMQSSQFWLPNSIQKISWDQIEFNPIWFYKSFIAKNTPCIITDTLQGDQICERWSQQKYLEEVLQNFNGISMSFTPDGFADSVKGEYFVEPEEIKTDINKFFNHTQEYPNTIPYIQHQNSSLTEQMWILNAEIDQDNLKFLSKHLFAGNQPDAQNFWLGYDQSVSSLHKDPYENFYTVITGEKHFTLLPPIDILNLEENTYKHAKWTYDKEKSSFNLNVTGPQLMTTWISCNPDLQFDCKNKQAFPLLQKCHKYHVVVEKSQMLYLPSLWYHQVSQFRRNDPYTAAINYWFDMQFGHNYGLYQMCRKLKGL